ncbi:hypothetical protein LTR84_008852 [Exophiala bonariae]|uniref:Amino acid permease/ SLC12A domain-containing protein n=1 Tax=Exophiala bonariae TaxID=1690606 RepID=A0AAV9MYD4_9EURO|nr:hypothetical protein LTR84_008852 [Exophiala bonariae]
MSHKSETLPGKTEGDVEMTLHTIQTTGMGNVEDLPDKVQDALAEIKEVRQGLKQRHIQMIALAGTIGTGLFLGSGRAIARGGPLGAFLGYTILGLTVMPVVYGVGEMGTLVPISGGIVRYSEYFVDPALAFANGWNLVYGFLTAIPAELAAVAVLVEFWNTSISSGVWITIFGLIMLSTALLFVGIYGEIEFTFSTLKIMLIIGVNIMALVITCGGGPSHETIGFRYWKNPGPFVQYLGISGSLGEFLGFWTVLSNALYAFSGIENITLPAAETKNPRRAIPMATKRIFWRILMFYVITIFMVGLVVPSSNPLLLRSTGTAAQSPFVIAAKDAGIKVVPSIINAIVLTSAWSSGNANILGGPRILFALAKHGHAPKLFTRINRFGVPYVAISLFGLFMCLAYMTLSTSANIVFGWLQDLVAISTLTNWTTICITYLRFQYACKAQGIDRHTQLPWAAPFQPWSTWISLVFFIVIYLTNGYKIFIHGHWDEETFVSSYLNPPVIVALYFIYKYVKKTKLVPLTEAPIRDFLQLAEATPEPLPEPKRGLKKLNFLWE